MGHTWADLENFARGGEKAPEAERSSHERRPREIETDWANFEGRNVSLTRLARSLERAAGLISPSQQQHRTTFARRRSEQT